MAYFLQKPLTIYEDKLTRVEASDTADRRDFASSTLGLDKNFVKAIHHQGEGFIHIGKLFPCKTGAKIKHDIFVRPEIRKVLKDKDFKTKLSSNELDAWNAFALVVQNFLGKHKATNYTENVEQMLHQRNR